MQKSKIMFLCVEERVFTDRNKNLLTIIKPVLQTEYCYDRCSVEFQVIETCSNDHSYREEFCHKLVMLVTV